MTAPLFDFGARQAQKRAAEAAMQASLAQYEQTVLTAFRQVADVLAALEHDAQALEAQQRALSVAQQSVRLTRESFAAGNTGACCRFWMLMAGPAGQVLEWRGLVAQRMQDAAGVDCRPLEAIRRLRAGDGWDSLRLASTLNRRAARRSCASKKLAAASLAARRLRASVSLAARRRGLPESSGHSSL